MERRILADDSPLSCLLNCDRVRSNAIYFLFLCIFIIDVVELVRRIMLFDWFNISAEESFLFFINSSSALRVIPKVRFYGIELLFTLNFFFVLICSSKNEAINIAKSCNQTFSIYFRDFTQARDSRVRRTSWGMIRKRSLQLLNGDYLSVRFHCYRIIYE